MLTIAEGKARLRACGVELFDPEPYRRSIQRTADEFAVTIHPCRRGDSRAYPWRDEMYAPWPPITEARKNDILWCFVKVTMGSTQANTCA